jgi:hypothetical protein
MIAKNLVVIARNFKSRVRPDEDKSFRAVEDGTCRYGTAMDISIMKPRR